MKTINTLNAEVIANVKRVDPDRYRAALFAAPGARARLLTLYAFHYELAKVPEHVSEPMIGAIRYQWWRDMLAEHYEGKPVRKHEVATPMVAAIEQGSLPRFWLDALIDGRERDLDPRPFENLDAAKDYCNATSGKLMQIAVQAAAPGLRLSADITDGIALAGQAWGLTGLARAYGYYHKSMLSDVGFDALHGAAAKTYDEANARLKKIDSNVMPAIAYAALVPKFLGKMMGDFDPLAQSVSYGPLAKQWRLTKAAIKGQI